MNVPSAATERRSPPTRRGLLVVALIAALLATIGAVAWTRPAANEVALLERRADLVLAAAFASLVLTLTLVVLVRRRPLVFVLALAVWWLGVETFGAPHLVRRFRLLQYFAAADPDHWPKGTGPDWNEHSLRATPPAAEFTESTVNLLLLGDSYTFGMHVKPKEAFPWLIGESLRAAHPEVPLRVANFGWSSSSPLLSYRRLLAIGDAYHPDVVVLCIDMTDFGDDIRWANIIEKRRVYWLYDKLPILLRAAQLIAPTAYERFVAWTVDAPARRFFHSEAPLAETRRHLEPLVENVARIAAWCTERGADFALVVLPRSYQHSAKECPKNWEAPEYEVLGPHALAPFEFFDELRGTVDYPIWSLLEPFRASTVFPLCLDHDPHWLPAGHVVAAEALTPLIAPLITARQRR